jgi:hypothetical protein
MCSARQLGTLAACLLAAAPMAGATPEEDASVEKVKQLAADGQDPATKALVNQYVDQHKDEISAILKVCMNFLNELKAKMGDSPSPGNAESTPGNAAAQPAEGPRLRMAALQPASGLRTSHLAGFPSLPDMAPDSSVKQLTADQLEYAAQVKKEVQERKEYLMTHPWGYSY